MKVVITSQAYRNLEKSLTFYKETLHYNTREIKKLREKLLSRALSLSDTPNIAQYEDNLKYLNKNHRRVIEGHFKIVYRISDNEIYITDFFDSRRNPLDMKGQLTSYNPSLARIGWTMDSKDTTYQNVKT